MLFKIVQKKTTFELRLRISLARSYLKKNFHSSHYFFPLCFGVWQSYYTVFYSDDGQIVGETLALN